MSGEAWESGFGIAYASSPTQEPAAPYIFPLGSKANVMEDPILYERRPAYHPDVDDIRGGGFKLGFNQQGVEGDLKVWGYLWWLFLGGDAFATGVHTITPADQNQYLNVFADRQADVTPGAGTFPVQRLIGGKITEIELVQKSRAMAQLNYSGMACNYGLGLASITPTIPTGADNAPLGWNNWQDAAGFLKIGLDGGAATDDPTIQGFSIKGARGVILQGDGTKGSNQPTAATSDGERTITAQFEKEFSGASAIAQYDAFRSVKRFSIDFKAIVGANNIEFTIPASICTASVLTEMHGKKDLIRAAFQLKALKDGTSNIITILAKDGTAALYNTLV